MKKLLKKNSKGKVQEWQIFVKGNTFYTVEGEVGGKLTTSKPTYCHGKNIGKKNETTDEQQAQVEALAKWNKKIKEGYSEKLGEGITFFEPMLAESYKDKETGEPVKSIRDYVWDKKKKIFIQPKLDGIRCINFKGLFSREGREFVSCPHLIQSDIMLDGELYNHKFKEDFNEIVSLVRKTKPDTKDLEESKKNVQMWVYDLPSEDPFSVRYDKLKKWFLKNSSKYPQLVLVPTVEIKSEAELTKYHNQWKSQGFEGSIIRVDGIPYENKRTTQLLKYKDFIDEEFEIVGYLEGKGGRAGTIGKFILKHDKYEGETFKSNVKGDFDYLRYIWKHRDDYIGKLATVQYFNRTPRKDGKGDVPRFGYVVKIDRDSYEGKA